MRSGYLSRISIEDAVNSTSAAVSKHTYLFLCLIFISFLSALLAACTADKQSLEDASANACPVTESVWAKPPEDDAVGSSEYGHYFVNEDRSIWASVWWVDEDGVCLHAGEEGIKMGWFRPEGAELDISGRRIDAQALPLETHIPCCYPTRFQATGLVFPTEGCWEVSAAAGDGVLSFVVEVEPGG